MARTPVMVPVRGCDLSGHVAVTTLLRLDPDGAIENLGNTWENPADEAMFPAAVKKRFDETNRNWRWV